MWRIFKKRDDRIKEKKPVLPAGEIKNKEEKRETEKVRTTKGSQDKKQGAKAEKIFIKPAVSEKTAAMGTFNTYGFIVAPKANKTAIKKAFYEIYRVRPSKITISNTKPKARTFRNRPGTQSGFKKAFVTVPAGVKVDIFEGV